MVTSRRYTDLFEWGQRTTPPSLAAEIQRRLLPAALVCEAGIRDGRVTEIGLAR